MAKQPQQQRPQQPQQRAQVPNAPKKAAPVPVQRSTSSPSLWQAERSHLLFGRQNFLYIGIGLALVLVGLLAMLGGAMPDPNKWEPERIYSFTRITLAPLLMVAGFVVVGIGIFKRSGAPLDTTTPTSPDEA